MCGFAIGNAEPFYVQWNRKLYSIILCSTVQVIACEFHYILNLRILVVFLQLVCLLKALPLFFTFLFFTFSEKVSREAAAELERMTRGKKPGSETNANDTSASPTGSWLSTHHISKTVSGSADIFLTSDQRRWSLLSSVVFLFLPNCCYINQLLVQLPQHHHRYPTSVP